MVRVIFRSNILIMGYSLCFVLMLGFDPYNQHVDLSNQLCLLLNDLALHSSSQDYERVKFDNHSFAKLLEIAKTFAVVVCVREITAKKSCTCGGCGLIEHLLFLLFLLLQLLLISPFLLSKWNSWIVFLLCTPNTAGLCFVYNCPATSTILLCFCCHIQVCVTPVPSLVSLLFTGVWWCTCLLCFALVWSHVITHVHVLVLELLVGF